MNIPRMSYPQYRKARRLTHECCNYCNGNCLLLDDGEECVCVQSISYSLLCRWFKVAVLPLDAALCAEITKGRDEIKRCAVCGVGNCFLRGVPTAFIVRPAPRNANARARSCGRGNTGAMRRKSKSSKPRKIRAFFPLWEG